MARTRVGLNSETSPIDTKDVVCLIDDDKSIAGTLIYWASLDEIVIDSSNVGIIKRTEQQMQPREQAVDLAHSATNSLCDPTNHKVHQASGRSNKEYRFAFVALQQLEDVVQRDESLACSGRCLHVHTPVASADFHNLLSLVRR